MKQIQASARRLQRTRYTPESHLRHPLQLFKRMIHDLLASRELGWQLMIRDISALYRQSFLGFFWAFIPAIAAAIGFTLAEQANFVNVGATDLPYPAYVMFSTALWQTFAEAVTGPVQAVTAAKQMLARINFPREALILSKMGQVFFNFSIKLLLIVALFIWYQIPVTWSILVAPVALVHLILLGTAFGLLLAPLGALYTDITKGLVFILGAWMLLTPVVYSVPQDSGLGLLVRMNPATPLLVTTRELAATGTVSDPLGFWLASLFAIALLLLAWLIYRLAMPFVVERMSA